jgi:serine protease
MLSIFAKSAQLYFVGFGLVLQTLLGGASGLRPASATSSVALIDSKSAKAKIQNLQPFQGYLAIAPGGMDVDYAWTLDGGSGENVKIIDIEYDWNLNHNDLQAAASNLLVYVPGVDPDPADDINHGTAVLGELVATNNDFGVTGIANQAQIGLINPQTSDTNMDLPGAIAMAASLLDPGDVILIELQMIGPLYDPQTGHGLVPVEFDSAVFAAIRRATSQGIVVVEPATNGAANLDDPVYNGAFNRNQHDSGAIIAGAGKPPTATESTSDRAPIRESDYGSRVDVQGWGKSIATCGFGDVRIGKGSNNWYTKVFGGTSGAAAMIAGAAAVVESIVKAQNEPALSPSALRQLLTSTGSAQTGNTNRRIGPRPDLRFAITTLNGLPPPPT